MPALDAERIENLGVWGSFGSSSLINYRGQTIMGRGCRLDYLTHRAANVLMEMFASVLLV